MKLEPGALIGNVRLLEEIAEGGTSTVWSARHLRLGHDVAVKFLRQPGSPQQAGPIDVDRREMLVASALESPHLVTFFEEGVTDDGTTYFVMELLDGIDLGRAVMATGPLTPRETHRLVEQIASVLERAHELGIVHRDIKPDNVFVLGGREMTFKLLDFGIAKFKGAVALRSSRDSRPSTMTRGGVVVGSPDFVSPEQSISSREIDHRSDLFALGILAYFAITAELPFATAAKAARWKLIEAGPISLDRWRVETPAGLDGWFRRALALLPRDRFQSAKQMSEALGRLVGEMHDNNPTHIAIVPDSSVAHDVPDASLRSPDRTQHMQEPSTPKGLSLESVAASAASGGAPSRASAEAWAVPGQDGPSSREFASEHTAAAGSARDAIGDELVPPFLWCTLLGATVAAASLFWLR